MSRPKRGRYEQVPDEDRCVAHTRGSGGFDLGNRCDKLVRHTLEGCTTMPGWTDGGEPKPVSGVRVCGVHRSHAERNGQLSMITGPMKDSNWRRYWPCQTIKVPLAPEVAERQAQEKQEREEADRRRAEARQRPHNIEAALKNAVLAMEQVLEGQSGVPAIAMAHAAVLANARIQARLALYGDEQVPE